MTRHPRTRRRMGWASLVFALPVVGAVTAAMTPATAHARRGVIVVNTGGDAMHIQQIARARLKELGAPDDIGDVHVSVMYERVGLFWLDIVRWDARFGLCEDKAGELSCEELTVEELAEFSGRPIDEIKKPWRFYAPPLGIAALGLILFGLPWYLIWGRHEQTGSGS